MPGRASSVNKASMNLNKITPFEFLVLYMVGKQPHMIGKIGVMAEVFTDRYFTKFYSYPVFSVFFHKDNGDN